MLDFSVTFLITIVNITVLFFILRVVLFKPVTKFMADRAKLIQDSIDSADADRKKAKELAEQYEAKIKEAEDDARKILEDARENAELRAQMIINEGKQEARIIAEAAVRQIEAEKQTAMVKFQLEAAALIVAASAKLTSRDFSGSENQRYANMLLDEIAHTAKAAQAASSAHVALAAHVSQRPE